MVKSDCQNLENKMGKANKIFSFLPVFIILYWIFCLVFLIDTQIYKHNFLKFDFIDTIITGISLVHAFFYWWDYKKISKYCVRAIIVIVILTFFSFYIVKDLYYFLYFWIIVTTIFETIRVNWNER